MTSPDPPSADKGGSAPRLERAGEIFFFVRELPAAERPAAIERACAGDPELKALVALLLQGDEAPFAAEAMADDIRAAGEMLERPAQASGSSAAAETVGLNAADYAGSRIGRYRLLERLGEGGFGVVFAAEQTEPVRRMVALKIIKLGMDTRQVVARFEAERQALAMMDHPNIARVFDAGATETGRPYFVMELVKGLPITEYCDARKLPIPARLELFALVCDALQHAHQKGIIHRDIKPSNVLVTEMGEKAVPKVIDFGIAKATEARLTEKTIFTEMRQMIGTPEYMSPEQAGVSGLDIDTRTDVYSLGVLLYELLAGTTPFDSGRLRSAAYGEMQRIIREEDPPRPSMKLTTLDTIADVARLRGIEPSRLGPALKGELDWVVMKCLEKERARRYDSAGSMMRDIQRFIGGDAVQAVPPSAAYRMKKMVRRNKGAVIAGGLLLTTLVAGLAGTSLGFFRAEGEKKVAVREKNRADANATQARAAEALATRGAYSANVMSASAAIDGVQYSAARDFLDAAPEQLRGWEWRVLDAKLDTSIRALSIPATPRGAVMGELAAHPDGRSFFTLVGLGDTLAQRWDVATGRLLQSFPSPTPAKERLHYRALLSPDGRQLTITPLYQAPGSKRFTIETWDLSSGERTARVEVPCRSESEAQTIVSRDGTRVFVYEVGRVWSTRCAPAGVTSDGADAAGPETLAEQPFSRRNNPFAMNHGDTLIAEGVLSAPYGLTLRDAHALAPVAVLSWRTLVQNACFSNDDRWLGVTGNDESARVWDLSATPPTSIDFRHPYQTNNIRFSPDASLVATISWDRAIRIWDRASGALLGTYPSETLDPYPLMFMPDGKTVAGWESNGTIRFWDVTAEKAAVLRGHKSIVSAAKFAVGNAAGIMVSCSWEGADGSTGIVRIWDTDTGDEVGIHHGGLGDIVYAMDVSDDGRYAALAITNWLATDRVLGGGGGAADELANRVEIIDLTTGTRLFASPSRRVPRWISFGRDHQSVIVADTPVSSVQSVQLHRLDTRSGAVIHTRELDPKTRWVFAGSPDGRVIAAMPTAFLDTAAQADRPGTMLLLDSQTFETVREIDGVPERQSGMAFSRDGARIAIGGEDGVLRLMSVDKGRPLAATSEQGMEVLAISFSPDGTRLASAGVDRKVRIWDANTLEPLAAFAGHQGHIGSLDWSRTPPSADRPDGDDRLISCSGDFTVRVWEPEPIRTRVQAREARAAALAVVRPLVDRLFDELTGAERVLERLEADTSLTPLELKAARQEVLRRGLAVRPE